MPRRRRRVQRTGGQPGDCLRGVEMSPCAGGTDALCRKDAPVGRIMNSCMARPLPAWEPPLMTLNAGTGSTWRR